MKIKKIKINTTNNKYNLYIGQNLINGINDILSKEKINFKKCFLVIDSKIGKKNSDFIKSKFIKYEYVIAASSSQSNFSQKSFHERAGHVHGRNGHATRTPTAPSQ